MEKKINVGRVVVTHNIARIANDFRFHNFILESLMRHCDADWGDLCEEDKAENERALKHGGRLFSSYNIPAGIGCDDEEKIYIITEHDRSCTTVLFSWEY